MSNLSRWDPFREMMTLRNAMDRLFESAFVGPQLTGSTWNWELPLDVIENDDEYVVKASLPGVNPDDLEVTYKGDVLTIKGEVSTEKDVEESRYHLRERHWGAFSRSITLPGSINANKIEAHYENGVLTLNLPKAEGAKPKRIAVQAGSSKMIEGKVGDIKHQN